MPLRSKRFEKLQTIFKKEESNKLAALADARKALAECENKIRELIVATNL